MLREQRILYIVEILQIVNAMELGQIISSIGWSEYLSILQANQSSIKYADQGMFLCYVMIDQQAGINQSKIDEVTFEQGMEAIKQILIGFDNNVITDISFSVLAHNLKEELQKSGHLI